jgi:hypothetical protein
MINFENIEPASISEVAQTLIFKTLWNHLPSKSFVSGLWLRCYINTPLWVNCFLHVLPVAKYPYFRHYMRNIVLVTPGERGLWLEGSEEERIQYALDFEDKTKGKQTVAWDEIKRLEASLAEEYKKAFPSTVGGLLNYRYSLNRQKEIIGKLNKAFIESLSK